ncbi:MAG: amidohydrolase family protein [Woeseia sp.]
MRNKSKVIYLPIMLFAAASRLAADDLPGEEYAQRAVAAGIDIPAPAPDRPDGEGRGPFDLLILKDVVLIDGAGAPPRGPVTITIRRDRIASIQNEAPEDSEGAYVIDGAGMYVMPGLIDSHAHAGNPMQGLAGPVVPPEYVFKLWMGHGVTTVRDVGGIMGLGWTVDHKKRSAANEITAPRIFVHSMFPGRDIVDAKGAREWTKAVIRRGADGVKLRGATEPASKAVIAEAKRLGKTTSSHHDQVGVYKVNVLTSARWGLDSMEHWYGLPEALFDDRTIQDYPPGYNYYDEQWRFGQAGRLWKQAAAPGSEKWKGVLNELLSLDFTLVPTFTIYEANRDVVRARDREWHGKYTLPALRKFFMPNPELHGSYHFDWTTTDEIEWGRNFRLWMRFINDYKNAGGRVATGSDAGFIFKVYGFALIRELELLQEAGFHPLEVVQAATLNGAELLGLDEEIGSVVPGKKADLIIIDENPVQNLKVLYGTGHMRLNRETGELERVGGVRYTVKDGIVWDARQLLADVRSMVREAR